MCLVSTENNAYEKKDSHRAIECEKYFNKLVLWEEGMSCYKVQKSAQTTPASFDELSLWHWL